MINYELNFDTIVTKIAMKLSLFTLVSSCQLFTEPTSQARLTKLSGQSGLSNLQKSKSEPEHISKIKSLVQLSRIGPPSKLNLEFYFQGNPKCSQYQIDVEIYKKNQTEIIHKETKIIKVKDYKCFPCLPVGSVNSCGNTCREVSLNPILAYIDFEFESNKMAQAELVVTVKNFKGLRLSGFVNNPSAEIEEGTQEQIEIKDCENEISNSTLIFNPAENN